jgi:tRNA (cytidine/uridine-2'-O-)-methyltransferase
LDYWEAVDLWVHPSWRHFRAAMARERCWYFSARATRSLWDAEIPGGACLVFGNESDGLPGRILEKHPERVYRIPMTGPVRSLNLATAVGIVVYDVLRRLTAQAEGAEERSHGGTAGTGAPGYGGTGAELATE